MQQKDNGNGAKYTLRWTLVVLAAMVSVIALALIIAHAINRQPVPNEFWIVLGSAVGYIGGAMANVSER